MASDGSGTTPTRRLSTARRGGTGHHGGTRRTRSSVALLVLLALVASACGSARDAPPIVLPVNAQPSAIYASDGTLITVLREENRINVPLERIPRTLQDAVVAIEDARFWEHNGVDPRAIARAAGQNAEAGEIAEGGSTITQQYVKQALLTDERTFGRKIEEATIALALERNYSKSLILELYLNTIYLGNGAYGVEAAAQHYFGVPVERLTLEQAALIAGVIQAPSRHDPRVDADAAMKRRNLVLRRMQEQELITPTQGERARETPIVLAPPAPLPEQAPYPAPHFVDEVKNWLLHDSDVLGDNPAERREMLLRGGLRIETTIDLDLQRKAEEAVAAVLRGQGTDPRTPDAALVSIEPRTGLVRAMVGGHDYFGTHSYRQANLAVGRGRSTGSAFKPIVMATALDAGVSPSKLFDAPSSAVFRPPNREPWRVKGGGIGAGTMHECTVVSSNTCYANIILDPEVGPERTAEMARKLGIVSTTLDEQPAMALGANDATVEDMAAVYATLANDGTRVPPTYVTKIIGPDGGVIHQHVHSQSMAVSPEIAHQVAPALEQVIQRGTGKSANIARPAGGKTGSAQNNTDAWFCGFTQELATAVWVGFAETREIRGRTQLVPMRPPYTRITVFGGTYPAQIWSRFMRSALEGVAPSPLFDPEIVSAPTTTVPDPDASFLEPMEDPRVTGSTMVPDVEGTTAVEAAARLRRAGLAVEVVRVEVPAAQHDIVVAQTPPPGGTVPSGTTVTLEATPPPPPPPTTTTTTTSSVPPPPDADPPGE